MKERDPEEVRLIEEAVREGRVTQYPMGTTSNVNETLRERMDRSWKNARKRKQKKGADHFGRSGSSASGALTSEHPRPAPPPSTQK